MPFTALAATLAIAIATGGCGSATDYRGKVRAVQARYEQRLSDLTTRATGELTVNPTAAAVDLAELARVMATFADAVAAIPPPPDQETLAGQLVGAYRTLATSTEALRAAILAHDDAGVQAAIARFEQAAKQEQAAVDGFNVAG